ncbi:MAG: Gfo/Idh/MocA family oxidoreductase [Chloroflexota bacterium]|nr:Gfo/Idh/MocA family oxidoreductase [Chloroflexota bacterium]
MRTRIGVIGAGFAGTTHARACRDIDGAEVVAVVAATREEAAPLAAECGARIVDSAAELGAAPDVDLVIVASPTYLHAEHAVAAARSGKQVFCEKPLARTLEQGEAIVEACESAGVPLAVGHVVRFFPEYQRAHDLIRDGAIGQPAVATLTRGSFSVAAVRPWYGDQAKSGGVLLDLMVHDLDTLRWWFGEPTRVYARRVAAGGLDYALATLRFAEGLIAHVEASWAEHAGFRTAFEVCGDAGMLVHDSRASTPLVVQAPDAGTSPAVMPVMAEHESPYGRQMRDLIERLARGDHPRVGGREGLATLSLAFAVDESVRCGEPVAWSP